MALLLLGSPLEPSVAKQIKERVEDGTEVAFTRPGQSSHLPPAARSQPHTLHDKREAGRWAVAVCPLG